MIVVGNLELANDEKDTKFRAKVSPAAEVE
jgi:hypothetical protein